MTKTNKTPGLLVKHDLNALTGWDELEASEQTAVKLETAKLDQALMIAGKTRLAIGEHLFKIREILEPKRIFTEYVKTQYHFSRATAYRWIDMYTAAKTILPAPIMRVAMMRGNDRLNIKMMTATPPPKTTNLVKINEYLSEMEKPGLRLVEIASPDHLKKEAYNYVHARYNKVPKKLRAAWIHSVCGMLLGTLGVSGMQSVEPVAVPEEYKVTRGRPRKMAKSA